MQYKVALHVQYLRSLSCQVVLRNICEITGGSRADHGRIQTLNKGVKFPNRTPGGSLSSHSHFYRGQRFIHWKIFLKLQIFNCVAVLT